MLSLTLRRLNRVKALLVFAALGAVSGSSSMLRLEGGPVFLKKKAMSVVVVDGALGSLAVATLEINLVSLAARISGWSSKDVPDRRWDDDVVSLPSGCACSRLGVSSEQI